MIKLVQNTSNNVALTLKEQATLSTPYYIFSFVNDDSGVAKVFTGSDVSVNPTRYNKFVIELNSVEDLNNSVIDLDKGFYTYKVYETETEFDLDLDNATSIVESGKVYVEGSEQLVKSIYTEGNDTKVVYNG